MLHREKTIHASLCDSHEESKEDLKIEETMTHWAAGIFEWEKWLNEVLKAPGFDPSNFPTFTHCRFFVIKRLPNGDVQMGVFFFTV